MAGGVQALGAETSHRADHIPHISVMLPLYLDDSPATLVSHSSDILDVTGVLRICANSFCRFLLLYQRCTVLPACLALAQ